MQALEDLTSRRIDGDQAGLVGTGDPSEPLRSQEALVATEICGDRAQWSPPTRDGGQIVTNALPMTLSMGT